MTGLSKPLVQIYHKGICDIVYNLTHVRNFQVAGLVFSVTQRDPHVAIRAMERKIDIIGLLKSARDKILNKQCEVVYGVYSGKQDIVVRTEAGNMVFRAWKSERGYYQLKLCTVTPLAFWHGDSFIIE